MKQRLTAWVYSLLAAVVCLSAAEGSVLLCWHTTGVLHTDSAPALEPAQVGFDCGESHCCEDEAHEACVDLQIDGLDLDFSVDQAKTIAPALVDLGGLHWSELIAAPTAVSIAQTPARGPPIVGPRVHVSVPSTVLRL